MIICPSPKISCVMYTTQCLEFIKPSVRCYFNQNYKDKELIVLSKASESQNQEIRQYLSALNREDIQFFESPQNLTHDAAMSLLTDLAKGDVLCNWSDLGLSHPNRLPSQLKVLLDDNRRRLCFYANYLEHHEEEVVWRDCINQKFSLDQFLPETIMCHRLKFCEFNTDNAIDGYAANVQNMSLEGNVGLVLSGYQYLYSTSDKGGVCFSKDYILNKIDLIKDMFDKVKLSPVSVKADGEIIFIYKPNYGTIN